MVLTLQGSVYQVTNAYSHYGSTNANEGQGTPATGCALIWQTRPPTTPAGTGGNRAMGAIPTPNGTSKAGDVAQGTNKQPAAAPG